LRKFSKSQQFFTCASSLAILNDLKRNYINLGLRYMFSNLKLRGKMLLGYSVPVALIAGLAFGVYLTSQEVGRNLDRASRAESIAKAASELELRITEIVRQSRGYALIVNKELLDRYEKSVEDLQESRNRALAASKDAIPEQRERIEKLVEISLQYEAITRTQVGAAKINNRKIVLETVVDGVDLLTSIDELLAAFNNRQKEIVTNAEATTKASLNLLVALSVIGASISLVIALVIAFLISSAIANTVNQAASEIASSSAQIASAVEEQERTVSQQASSVNETSTTMGELGTSSRQSAEQAEVSASGARHALSLTEGGTKAVRQTLNEMTTLKDKVGAIAEQILRLSEQTNQIGNISGLVGDLANQTNMLALNAAVEAARAGDHGRGFAVVAEEIRKLADQSKKSAEKINTLVSDIQTAINSTVMVTDEGNKTVNEGLSLARSMADTFTGVSDSINNVFISSQQISLNAKQQAVAINQVVEAMNAINLGARETASGVSQIKVSTHQLNSAAQKLQAVV
jgi:methyl-accepting chemotaxis protein